MPQANAEAALGLAEAGGCGASARKKRSRATAQRGAEPGGGGDEGSECVSRNAFAMAASPTAGP
eukprot:6178097-Pleurochrysis_carterae.AAC.1